MSQVECIEGSRKGTSWVGRQQHHCTESRTHKDDRAKEVRSHCKEHSLYISVTLPGSLKCLVLTKLVNVMI